ncbi:DUF881 domain-containing protein [Gracilibacillus sp. YIM 98692]|uniref:DUF881 domain-containing protein n=1 Tax=Gracilibacillus sp. YIM 98692 TaxID=2663532 RepID=UPI0013D17084|nr:DUF881 domain-containing protein [Gracilibacillus sp. YIM 98692]
MKILKISLSIIFLLTGFWVTYSIQQGNTNAEIVQLNDNDWDRGYFYRKQLIEIEESNKQLRAELSQIRQNIQELEQKLADDADTLKNLVETKVKLQKFTGEMPIKGEGVSITLRDASYIPDEDHANQYIVHDRHIHRLVNELYTTGAKAVAINGQRIYSDSYIACVGPIITVDGNGYPAPFVITAIGDQEVLEESLYLKNGVIDMLVQDNVEVTFEKNSELNMLAKEE